MVPLLAALFILVPLAELAVIITVAHSFGVLNTLVLLLVFSVFGAWLTKRLLAGALLFTPGFITDAIGLLLLVPATRILLRRWVPALALRRMGRRGRIRVRDESGTEVHWGRPEIDDRDERL